MHLFCFLIVWINFKAFAENYEWEINNEIGFDIKEFHKEEAFSNQNSYENRSRQDICPSNHQKFI